MKAAIDKEAALELPSKLLCIYHYLMCIYLRGRDYIINMYQVNETMFKGPMPWKDLN